MPNSKFGPYSDYADSYVVSQQLSSPASSSPSTPPSNASPKNKSWALALASVAGSLISSYMSYRNQQSINSTNRDLARQQNRLNLEQWQRENSYNSPLAQIERLRAAGLNPGLLMSSGIENIAAQSPQMVSSQGRASAQFSNPFSQFASDIKTSELMDAQRENIEADTKMKLSNAGLTDIQSQNALVKLEVNKEWLATLTEDQHKQFVANIDKIGVEISEINQKINNLKAEEALKLLEGEKLRKYIDEIQPAELDKLRADTTLTQNQAQELVYLAAQKMLLLKAQTYAANASGSYQAQMAKFQKALNDSPDYVQAVVNSVVLQNGKLALEFNKAGNSNFLAWSDDEIKRVFGDSSSFIILLHSILGAFMNR